MFSNFEQTLAMLDVPDCIRYLLFFVFVIEITPVRRTGDAAAALRIVYRLED